MLSQKKQWLRILVMFRENIVHTYFIQISICNQYDFSRFNISVKFKQNIFTGFILQQIISAKSDITQLLVNASPWNKFVFVILYHPIKKFTRYTFSFRRLG